MGTREAAVATGNPGVKMVFTGYCGAVSPECSGPDGTYNMSVLQSTYHQLALENDDVTYVDVSPFCGGTPTTSADPQYFKDGIHCAPSPDAAP